MRLPAVRVAALIIGGILGGTFLPLHPSIPGALSAFALTGALVAALAKRRGVSDSFLQLAVFALIFLRQVSIAPEAAERTLSPSFEDEPVTLSGVIDSDPAWSGLRGSFILQTDTLRRDGRSAPNDTRLLVLVKMSKEDTARPRLQTGDRVRFSGSILPVPGPGNPGEFDYARYLALNDVFGIVTTEPAAMTVEPLNGGGGVSARIAASQRFLYALVDSLHPREHAAFIKGVVLGFRGELSPEVKQSFLETGTIHILAVSGSNVAVVALAFTAVLGFARFSRRVRACAVAAGILAYMLITGSSASVVRATIMALLVLGGTLLERKSSVTNILAFAAVVLLLLNPLNLFDVGFQLSFSAVWSLVFFYPHLEKLIERIPPQFEEIRGVDAILKLGAVSLAAQIGTIPFTACYFNRLSIVSIVANLVVVPVSGINTLVSFAEAAFVPVSMECAKCFAAVNDLLIWFLLGFVREAAAVPYASVDVQAFSPLAIAVYYLIAIGIFQIGNRRTFRRYVLSALAGSTLLVWRPIFEGEKPHLDVSALDVGQGDAILIRTPRGRTILVDAGPSTGNSNAGERTIVPYLRREGIGVVDALFLSHPHDDHTGGAMAILREREVRKLVLPAAAREHPQFQPLIDAARKRGGEVVAVGRGESVLVEDSMRIFVLSPERGMTARNLNDYSLILKIVYGETSMILPGDAEEKIEEDAVRWGGDFLRGEILKTAHHGSATSSSAGWLRAVQPRWSVISVGRKNRFGHPSPGTLIRLREMGGEVVRTDSSGAVIFDSDGKTWSRRRWR